MRGERTGVGMSGQRQGLIKWMAAILLEGAVLFYGGWKLHAKMAGNTTLTVFFVAVMAGGAVALALVSYFAVYRNTAICRLYLMLGIIFGVTYIFLVPVYTAPDEIAHFDAAYAVSNKLLGVTEEVWPGTMYKRQCDAAYLSGDDREHLIADAHYTKYLQSFGKKEDTSLTLTDDRGTGGMAVYLPGALGMTVARMLHLNFTWMTFLGTLFQLAFFLAVVFYAMRLLPVGQKTLAVIALLPMTLQQASSFSYDNMVIALSILIVSLTLHWMAKKGEKGPQRAVQIIFYALAVLALGGIKGGIYAVLGLLPLCLLPFGRLRKDKKALKVFWFVCGAFAMFLAVALLTGLGRTLMSALDTYHYIAERDAWAGSVLFYLRQPVETCKLLANTVVQNGKEYLYSSMGGLLGWWQIAVSGGVIWMMLLLFLLSFVRTEGDGVVLSSGRRAWFGVIAVIVVLLCFAGMLIYWTPVFSDKIEGVQGRYFIPALLPGAVAVGYWKKPVWGQSAEGVFMVGMCLLNNLVCIQVMAGAL